MKICSVDGCLLPARSKGRCNTHYARYRKHGTTTLQRRTGKNAYYVYNDFVLIELYDKHGNVKNYAVIDFEDLEKVLQLNWWENSGYVCAKQNGKTIKLHRFILDFPCQEVDHKDGDPLYNRKKNLRVVTHQKNMENQKIRTDNKSGVRGVYRYKGRAKACWKAEISVKGKKISLGYFDELADAVKARRVAELQYHDYAGTRYSQHP